MTEAGLLRMLHSITALETRVAKLEKDLEENRYESPDPLEARHSEVAQRAKETVAERKEE